MIFRPSALPCYLVGMHSLRRRLILIVLFILTVDIAFASDADLPISAISVRGLKRTKTEVVDTLLFRFVGIPSSAVDSNEVIGILLKTGIFENIEVAAIPADDGASALLSVTLEEKWTIIPIPVFVASSDGITAGAGVIDANAFGLNDKLFSVALLLPAGWMAAAAYVDLPSREGAWRRSFSVFFSRREQKNQDASEAILRSYELTAADIGVEAAAPIGASAYLSFGLSLRERAVGDLGALAAPASKRGIFTRLGFSARSSNWNGVFLSESSISFGTSWAFGLVGDSFYTAEARAELEHAVLPGLRFRAEAAAVYAPGAPPVFEFSPAQIAVSILPSNFSARSAAGGSAGWEARLFRLPFGVVSAIASYQAAYAAGDLIGEVFAHGPTGGIRLYVAKIAVPAMDISAAYNAAARIARASFGIGMRM